MKKRKIQIKKPQQQTRFVKILQTGFGKRLFKVGLIALSLATVYSFAAPKFLNPDTAFAVGDLTIDWGVPTGDPIFDVFNMLPGDVEDRNVIITNSGIITRGVAVRGVQKNIPENLENVIDFVISEGGNDLYGGTLGAKTLADFFTDAGGPSGLFLFDLAPSQTKTVNFEATFQSSAGNEYQNTKVVFDLIIGISFDVPEECNQIEFSGDPIFGTALGDAIDGTEGNDLINGLEGGDAIDGKGGDDCIIGNLGGDYLEGGEGNDVMFGNEDGDTLLGEGGTDLLIGNSGGDTLKGGQGEDQLFGNEGHDTLEGGDDNDLLFGAGGDDNLFGNGGNDQLFADAGSDSLDGGNGDDLLHGGSGVDSLNGANGEDDIFGDEDLDSLLGGNQDDYLDGGAGGIGNIVNGQTGTDTCLNGTFSNCEIFPP